MVVNVFNKKRSSGKTQAAIENAIGYAVIGDKVLFLCRAHSRLGECIDRINKCNADALLHIDFTISNMDYLDRKRGIKYDCIIVDDCFDISLDQQNLLLRAFEERYPDAVVLGFGTDTRDRTFRDFILAGANLDFGDIKTEETTC